jgi:hypothetical protein
MPEVAEEVIHKTTHGSRRGSLLEELSPIAEFIRRSRVVQFIRGFPLRKSSFFFFRIVAFLIFL